jgi:tetratricopeptide (TPR) repeat protein
MFPDNAAISLRLAMMNFQDSGAEALFSRALQNNPFNIDTLNNFALFLMENGKNNEAGSLLEQAIVLAPDFARAHFNLGLLAAASNQNEAAIMHYGQAVECDPAMTGAWRNLANTHFKMRRFRQAMEIYQQAVAIIPEELFSHLGIGNCLMELQDYSEAEKLYRQLTASFTTSHEVYFSLGNSLEKQSRLAEACQNFITAGELGYPPGYRRAIEIILGGGFQPGSETFLSLTEKACRLTDFSDPWFLQIHASALLDTNRKSEALFTLHQAHALAIKANDRRLSEEIANNISLLNQ